MGIGTIAGILTTGAFIPQAVQIYRTKDAGAISASMYYVQITGLGSPFGRAVTVGD